jgi:hypothetical protein
MALIGLGTSTTYYLETNAATRQTLEQLSPARRAELTSRFATNNIDLLYPTAASLYKEMNDLQRSSAANFLIMENQVTLAEVLRRADERNALAARRLNLDPLVGCTFIQQTDSRLKIVCNR